MKAIYPEIALQGEAGLMFIHPAEILYALADGNYSHLVLTENRRIKVLRKLKEIHQLLSQTHFVRIHRSHIINLEHIVRFDETDAAVVLLSDGQALALARNRRTEFMERFTRI